MKSKNIIKNFSGKYKKDLFKTNNLFFFNVRHYSKKITDEEDKRNLAILKEDIQQVWNMDRLTIKRFPIVIGEANPVDLEQPNQPNVLDMPIKFPSQTFQLPYPNLSSILSQCIAFENQINPTWEDSWYCYLTYHRKFVKAGTTHRRSGIHFDGLQGKEYPEKLLTCHQYLLSNSDELSTRYYEKAFDIKALDPNKHNIFTACQYQIHNDPNCKPITFDKYKIVFSNAYIAHESALTNKDIDRTFCRIEFSQKIFNRVGNSINPYLKFNVDYVNRSIPSHLTLPESYDQDQPKNKL